MKKQLSRPIPKQTSKFTKWSSFDSSDSIWRSLLVKFAICKISFSIHPTVSKNNSDEGLRIPSGRNLLKVWSSFGTLDATVVGIFINQYQYYSVRIVHYHIMILKYLSIYCIFEFPPSGRTLSSLPFLFSSLLSPLFLSLWPLTFCPMKKYS